MEEIKEKPQYCKHCGGQLDKFGRKLPVIQPDGFPIAELAADNIIVRPGKVNPAQKEVLLIKRGKEYDPYKGKWALPGGRVDYGEDPVKGCLRELEEECVMKAKAGVEPKMLGVYGDPKRDKRGHVISIAYVVEVDKGVEPKAGSDAADAKFMPIEEVLKTPEMLAFDHEKILKDFVEWSKKSH